MYYVDVAVPLGFASGKDGDCITAKVWLAPPHAGRVDADGSSEATPRADKISTMRRSAAGSGGSSRYVKWMLTFLEPASRGTGRIADKGVVNQAAVRDRHADPVALPWADPLPSRVVVR